MTKTGRIILYMCLSCGASCPKILALLFVHGKLNRRLAYTPRVLRNIDQSREGGSEHSSTTSIPDAECQIPGRFVAVMKGKKEFLIYNYHEN
ncbi:hypothetical protein DE146DRAFT_272559 [Phaeosphaeria sp. MPI-PUGE-AT-0046c]|nr:hypothetical protein DE146DRAFT_272559 [Phaeosphaeria sp. MPI-PUGE-AT-0046c]